MKILIFLRELEGGVNVVIGGISKEFRKKGHIVNILSRRDDLQINSTFSSLFKIRRYLWEEVKRENYDVIYTQDWSCALPLLFPYKIFKNKHYCCFHGNQNNLAGFFQEFVGRILGKNLIVVGDALKERFPKSNIVYNGVDMNQFKPLQKRRNCLGWIEKQTEILKEKDIINLAHELKLKPLIAKKYSIPFKDMNKKFYNRCKIFVSLPPRLAGFNLCWIEAMAAGVPIIVGNDEGVGIKLPINKIKDAKKLEELIKKSREKDYRSELLNTHFTWEENVNQLLRIWTK